MDYLIDPSFQGVNKNFVFSFKDNAHQIRYTGYFLSKVEIKDYNIMINGQSFFDQPVKDDLRTYENVWKIMIDQGDHDTTGCLLDYP